MKLAIECITKNYFNFKGRASRKEYFLFYLLSIIPSIISALFHLPLLVWFPQVGVFRILMILLLQIVSLVLIIPGLAVVFRRLHDTNRSAWFYLIALIPIVGPIWLLIVLFFKKGTEGENKYGNTPLKSTPV